jgi:hypothetical protein
MKWWGFCNVASSVSYLWVGLLTRNVHCCVLLLVRNVVMFGYVCVVPRLM